MNIELLEKVMIGAGQDPKPAGTVLASNGDKALEIEFQALIGVGYAKVTNKTPEGEPSNDDAALLEILAGNADEVNAALDSLDKVQLTRLADLEAASAKPRKGVSEDIAAAIAAAE